MARGGPLVGTLSKLRGYCARLALILQLLRWACGEGPADVVDEVSMRGAIELAHYFASHAERVQAAMMTGGDAGAADPAPVPLLEAVATVVADAGGEWCGTATDLLAALDGRGETDCPRDPGGLSRRLRKHADWFAGLGFVVEFVRATDRSRSRTIRIKKASEPSDARIDDGSPGKDAACASDAPPDAPPGGSQASDPPGARGHSPEAESEVSAECPSR
jgi:hypothetical protein